MVMLFLKKENLFNKVVMNVKLEFFIAWRYLKSKKQEGFISVVALFSLIGTALGVAALIAVMAVMAGVREEWTNMLIGAVGDINIYSRHSFEIEDYNKVISQIKLNKQVLNATPVVEKQALLAAGNSNVGIQVRGLSKEDLEKKTIIADKIISGSIKDFDDNNIIIGLALSNNLNVNIGDYVKIISPQTSSTVIGNIPRIKTCKVVAFFNAGTPDLDNLVVFMPIALAQTYFKIPNKVNVIEVNISKSIDVEKMTSKLDKDLNYEYRLVDWKQRNSAIMGALKIEKMAMFMILTLIMIVAAFNIISGLIMLVKDKNSDIAILRTMGATKNMIVRIFLICGSSIGIFGTILGAILGISFATNIENIRIFLQSITGATIFDPLVYFLSFLPAKIYTEDVITIIAMSLSLSLIATIYPAYKAAKLNPATALKG